MRFLVATVFAVLVSTCLGQDQLTVQTQQGPVTGTLIAPGVRQFLGIPYAVTNRWQPPKPPPVRTTTFLANNFSSTCLQQLSRPNKEFLNLFGLSNQTVQESENCLSVNIWTPASNRKQNAAVMIWIHGGGYEFGTSDTVFYNGSVLVGSYDDVLVVTLNYRTNIFGFPGALQLNSSTQSQNFGALDVEIAINWVHGNIASFGGDPNRIVLWGQSAGSGIISAYTFSHPADTIVTGIIEQSASLAGMPAQVTTFGQPLNTTAWTEVAASVGCGNASTPAQLACMEGTPADTIKSAVVSHNIDFVPIQDGITFFTDASARSAAGHFLHVPLLVGNTAQEGDVFMFTFQFINKDITFPGLFNLGSELLTELVFTCPAGVTAGDYVTAGVPVWRYRYEAIFPDISTSGLRAYHASEIPLVFGTYNFSTFGPAPTADEIALSQYMQGAWVAFARNPQQGLTNYGWPQYNPLTPSLAQLGNSTTNATGVTFIQGNFFEASCAPDVQEVLMIAQIVSALGVLP